MKNYTFAYYLQPSTQPQLDASFGDFRDVQSVPRTDIGYLVSKRRLRLSPMAREFLQARLSNYFGRYAVDEAHFLTDEEREAHIEDGKASA